MGYIQDKFNQALGMTAAIGAVAGKEIKENRELVAKTANEKKALVSEGVAEVGRINKDLELNEVEQRDNQRNLEANLEQEFTAGQKAKLAEKKMNEARDAAQSTRGRPRSEAKQTALMNNYEMARKSYEQYQARYDTIASQTDALRERREILTLRKHQIQGELDHSINTYGNRMAELDDKLAMHQETLKKGVFAEGKNNSGTDYELPGLRESIKIGAQMVKDKFTGGKR